MIVLRKVLIQVAAEGDLVSRSTAAVGQLLEWRIPSDEGIVSGSLGVEAGDILIRAQNDAVIWIVVRRHRAAIECDVSVDDFV